MESPYVLTGKNPIVLLARKNGKYIRPIIGNIVDLRAEDIVPHHINYTNIVAKLPNVGSQREQYIIATAAVVDKTNATRREALQYLSDGYLELPSDNTSPLWAYTKSPWWEYVSVMDDHNGYIKAPKIARLSEPTPDDIDEKLDDFPENNGEMRVLSPTTLRRTPSVVSYQSRVAGL